MITQGGRSPARGKTGGVAEIDRTLTAARFGRDPLVGADGERKPRCGSVGAHVFAQSDQTRQAGRRPARAGRKGDPMERETSPETTSPSRSEESAQPRPGEGDAAGIEDRRQREPGRAPAHRTRRGRPAEAGRADKWGHPRTPFFLAPHARPCPAHGPTLRMSAFALFSGLFRACVTKCILEQGLDVFFAPPPLTREAERGGARGRDGLAIARNPIGIGPWVRGNAPAALRGGLCCLLCVFRG